MKTLLFLLFFPATAFCQASVAYYPFNSFGLFTVSTNPDKPVWLDARLQTNSLFEQLSTTFCPMFNVSRTERANFYVGPGIKLTALNAIDGGKVLDGYSLHVGVRVAPVVSIPNLRVAFELSPSAAANFKSGIFYSYLGFVYQFNKRGGNTMP
ncbi:hypothetical protein J2I47_02440 [Fibrella sp. HMF5335]|uniref:Outer membrane protein beta-barrel domain-containing protein n=1 Tax=Fibrella rubiginis TaxID=2817060 RepID=A0A939GCR9_9BACT|nr:hypothetical protein [Fibrella rubiginis]MBO0935398.1 hypothetical protein [Fibrella rubiginis]